MSPHRKVLILGVATVLFVLGTGPWGYAPLWERPYAIDANIIWSYLVIPPLVWFLLPTRRLLRFALISMELLLYKFLITLSIATALWMWVEPPPPPPPAAPVHTRAKPQPPSEIPDAQRGRLVGAAPAGALVFVETGLEAYRFAPPAHTVTLKRTVRGIEPPLAVLHPQQPIRLESDATAMTLLTARPLDGSTAFNLPVLTSPRPFALKGRSGIYQLTKEASFSVLGHLVVLPHPYFTIADIDGAFVIEGVPRETVTVGIFFDGDVVARRTMTVQ